MKLNFREGNRFNALRDMVTNSVTKGIAKEDCLTAVKVMCNLIGYEESDLWMETLVNDAYTCKPIDVTVEATPENYERVVKALNGEFGQELVQTTLDKAPVVCININRPMSMERADQFRHAMHEAFPEGFAITGKLV
jgi:hypothetical protein